MLAMVRAAKRKKSEWGDKSQKLRFGAITINIYTNPANGTHTLSATVAGKRYKVNRGRRVNLRSEAAKFAADIAQGEPERSVEFSQKKLDYYAKLETKMNGLPLDVAVDFYLSHQDEKLVRRKIPELATQFLKELRATVSKRYFERVEDELNLFAKEFKGTISDVTSAQVSEWIAKRKVGNRTQNHIRSFLGRLWKYAQVHNAIPRRDKTIIDWVPTKKSAPMAKQIYTPEEMKTILAACDRDLLPVFAIGAFAGIRNAEITGINTEYLGMDWSHILWDKNAIIVPGQEVVTKDGKREIIHQRIVPLLPNLKAWLNPYREETGLIWKLKHLQHRTVKIEERTGIKLKHNGLRHSFCTYRASAEKDLAKVAMEAGNSIEMLRQHYVRPQLEEVGREWFAIMPEAVPGSQTP